jgi:hypothetical protein
MPKPSKFPGWRHMTAAQRYNARKDAIFEEARRLGAFDPKPEIITGLGQFRAGNGRLATDWHNTEEEARAAFRRLASN